MNTQFKDVASVFTVRSLSQSIDFYVGCLGFQLEFVYGDPEVYAGIRKDNVVDSWWLKGQKDGNDNMEITHDTDDPERDNTNSQQLLHRMFENFLDGTARMDHDEDHVM